MSAWVISKRGHKGLKDIFLNKLISLDDVCSYCLTEPGSGSDAAALRTKADITNEGYDITGSKSFISGGGFSDLYVVLVRTGDASPNGISMVVVRNGTEGLSFGKKEQKMGWKAQPTAVVQFDDCSIPSTNLVGEEGSGFKYAMEGLDGGRLNIAAASLGGAQKSLNIAKAYAKERTAFGKPISKFQSIEFKLADMETQLEAARLFLRSAAWKLDSQKSDATVSVAMAKRFVTDVAFEVSNNALQILGGYGYLEEYGIEKIVRDLRVHQILEGTNEIMRVIIARSILAN
jgi:alkylation response protein AidB-like acyl-CoA dehydrogenase